MIEAEAPPVVLQDSSLPYIVVLEGWFGTGVVIRDFIYEDASVWKNTRVRTSDGPRTGRCPEKALGC